MSGVPTRGDYAWFSPITTRWMDNDRYGHVNNVTYYSYFDSVANRYLIEEGGLDIDAGPVIGYVVSSACDYVSPLAYPQQIDGGLRVDRLGTSSVTYGLAIFAAGAEAASAHGRFVHVFVDRATERPVAIPHGLRAALERLLRPAAEGAA